MRIYTFRMTNQQVATGDLDTPGKRIRFLRMALDMTQETLARKVYVTQAAISRWENGLDIPTKPAQILLAQTLNTTRQFLFGEQAA